MARTNVLTTAKRIRRQLGTTARQEQGLLFADISNSVTSLQFSTPMPNSVQPGVVLGIDTELLRVISVNPSTLIATVMRGYLDTDAATHTTGALIDIAPRYSLVDVIDAMTSEIDSWGNELYYTDSATLAVATSAETLELPVEWANVLGVVDCLQSETNTVSTVWPRIPGRLIRGSASTFSGAPTSGMLIRFHEGIRTGSMFVTVALAYDTSTMTTASDLVVDLHLSRNVLDVLELGTRLRLIMNQDDMRGGRTAQDESRRAEETPIGSLVSLSQLRLARYTRRKADEMARLNYLYPLRMT